MVYFASRYVFIMHQVFDGTYLNFFFIGGHVSKFRLVCMCFHGICTYIPIYLGTFIEKTIYEFYIDKSRNIVTSKSFLTAFFTYKPIKLHLTADFYRVKKLLTFTLGVKNQFI